MPLLVLALAILLTSLAAGPGALAGPRGRRACSPATSPLTVRSIEAFERELKELGWIPGQTIRIEYRHAEARPERLDELAHDLVRAGVDVIVARSTSSIQAAKRATPGIPIVMSATGNDPS